MDNSFFNSYAYTDFHELNLSWVIRELRTFATTLEQFVSINALKYADPIQWNIVNQYEKNTIVIDPQTGTAYISVQPVPSGVAITNTDYWTIVFDLSGFIVRAAQNFTDKWEQNTTTTATFPTTAGDWLVWGDVLYRAKVNIIAGDTYVVDSNIEHFTMEDIIGHLESLSSTDKTSLVNAINSVITEFSGIIGDLNDLSTTDTSSVVNAINSVWTKVGASTLITTAQNLSDAVNEVETHLGNTPLLTVAQNASDAINELETHLGNTPLQTIAQNASDAINEVLHYDNLYGVKVGFWGDSIMYGLLQDLTQSSDNYPTVFGSLTGAVVTNNAVSGQSITNINSGSFCNVVSGIDFTPYDYVVLAYGNNDIASGAPLTGNDNTAIDYAWRYCIATILGNNPKAKIIIASPAYCTGIKNRYAPHNNCPLDAYYIERKIAAEYNLPFVDMLFGPGINSTNISTYSWDGVHMYDLGYKTLGEFLARNFIQSVIPKKNVQQIFKVDTGTESSGYRITWNSTGLGDMDRCIVLLWANNLPGFSIGVCSYEYSAQYNMALSGATEHLLDYSGVGRLDPDASTAVSFVLDKLSPTEISGTLTWYGTPGVVCAMIIPF